MKRLALVVTSLVLAVLVANAATPESISYLRNKYGLVGIQLSSGASTIAVQQLDMDRFQIVEIFTTVGAEKIKPLTNEFATADMPSIAEKTSRGINQSKIGRPAKDPWLNASSQVITTFVSSGSPATLAAAVPVGIVALAIDVITSPFQLAAWTKSALKYKYQKYQLSNAIDMTSNDILILTPGQFAQVKQSLSQALPYTQSVDNCHLVYK
jgi:hypothetical protein